MKKLLVPFGLLLTVWLTAAACSPDDDTSPEMTTPVSPAPGPDDPDMDDTTIRNITIRLGGRTFSATLEDNAAGRALAALLPMTVPMTEMNGNEKYYYLSENLPTESARPGTVRNGDLMLYGSNCLVLFYKTFPSSYSYTRLGRIDNPDGLAAAAGSGSVTVTFEGNDNQ